MSESRRSFFSTIPGLITGLAGLLTGIVGLVTVLIQLGVLGDDDSTSVNSTGSSTTVAGGGTSGGATGGSGGATTTTEVPRFTVSPTTLDFPAGGSREKTVKVTNESNSAMLTVQAPRVSGTDRAQFAASSGDCNRPVRAGESCELKVTFSPSGPLRRYEAVLQVSAQGARSAEVPITASSLLS